MADRRPIAARRLPVVIGLADWLIRRGVSANAISLAGMAAALLAGVLLACLGDDRAAWLAAAVLVPLRLLANMLDGMVAIGRGTASRLGELFNEVPDRISDAAILAGLGIGAGIAWLGFAAAAAALATAYVRALGVGLGQRADFRGPMAKQQRMAVVTLTCLWCAAAPHRLARPAPAIALALITALACLTAARRLLGVAGALRRAGG